MSSLICEYAAEFYSCIIVCASFVLIFIELNASILLRCAYIQPVQVTDKTSVNIRNSSKSDNFVRL